MPKATIKDIAKEANVSVGTVSGVLNRRPKISKETREKVLEIIHKRNYTPSSAAIGLVSGRRDKPVKKRSFAFVIPSTVVGAFSMPVAAKILNGITMESSGKDVSITTEIVSAEFRHSTDLPKSLKDGSCGGVIYMGHAISEFIKQVYRMGVPIVLTESTYLEQKLDSILVDNLQASFSATQHLITSGHRRIALFADHPDLCVFPPERHWGYSKALESAGLSFDPSLVFHTTADYQGGYNKMRELIALGSHKSFTAVYCLNDSMALGAMAALQQAGVKVPDEVSVVGYDDIDLAAQVSPALTTLRPPMEQIGRMAIRRLMELSEGKNPEPTKNIVFAELVERGSVKTV